MKNLMMMIVLAFAFLQTGCMTQTVGVGRGEQAWEDRVQILNQQYEDLVVGETTYEQVESTFGPPMSGSISSDENQMRKGIWIVQSTRMNLFLGSTQDKTWGMELDFNPDLTLKRKAKRFGGVQAQGHLF